VGWTDWFARRNPPEDVRPSLRDVTFDTSGFELAAKKPDSIEWRDADDERLLARMDRAGADHPLTPWTLEALRSSWRNAAAARDGGIVSVTFDRAGDVPIAKAIAKFSDGMGYMYEGTVQIRFRDAVYSLTLQARERGVTGIREAIVAGPLMQLGELRINVPTPPAVSAPMEGWTRDPYDVTYDGPTLHSLSDDERLDELLPEHPLSKVRHWLESVRQTLSVADDLHGDVVKPEGNGPSAGDTAHRMSGYAVGLLNLQGGRVSAAERHLAAAIPLRDGEPILDAPRLGDTLILLGVAREGLGRLEEAAWAHGWAVRAFAATRGDGDPETVRARANLARAYALNGRHAEAEPLLTEVVPFFETTGNRGELSLALNALGLVRQSQTRHAHALQCFERALTLSEQVYGPNHVESAIILGNIARSAEATGDSMKSTRALSRAEEILQKRP
jgi:hypothetical protein